MAVRQALLVQAEQVQDGRVQIVDVNLVGRRPRAQFIGGAVSHSAFDASAGHPHRVAAIAVIAGVAGGAELFERRGPIDAGGDVAGEAKS